MSTKLEKKTISQTFNKISKRYDLINRVLSFGIDIYWRSVVRRHLPIHPSMRLLDLATGTADQIIALMNRAKNIRSAIGIDLAVDMLSIGKAKIARTPYNHQVSLLEADACNIPLNNETTDCVTMSFGIRNVPDVGKCLREMYRVLTHRGRALVLEFSLPKNRFLKSLHLFYLRNILPRVGRLLSKNDEAYTYLNETIETFPSGRSFCALLEEAGFSNVRAIPLTFGIVTLYVAEKMSYDS